MTKKERVLMQQHLRHLGVLGLKANVKHHKVVDTISTYSKDLLRMYKAEKKINENLRFRIDELQYDNEELNTKNTDLLWDLSKLEKKVAECEKEESEVAHYEKLLTKQFKKESVDN